MNRRKKEADQHKGWNISISGVFIAMVMGIVLISVVAATLIFVQIYRNAMEQSAVTSSFSRTCCRSYSVYFCITFAVSNLCNQNFPGSSGSSDTTGYSDRNRSRRYCWMGKWILRSEIPLTSIHCNTGNTADRIRNSSDVHYAER